LDDAGVTAIGVEAFSAEFVGCWAIPVMYPDFAIIKLTNTSINRQFITNFLLGFHVILKPHVANMGRFPAFFDVDGWGAHTEDRGAPPRSSATALVSRKLYLQEVGFWLPTNKMRKAIIIFKIYEANKTKSNNIARRLEPQLSSYM
jgi:hypothetical protein